MPVADLKKFAEDRGIVIPPQDGIVNEALRSIISGYGDDPAVLKENFDEAVSLSEKLAYGIYLKKEREYGRRVFLEFAEHLSATGEIRTLDDLGTVLGDHFTILDHFYLSLAQSRKSRAGKGFEEIHNSLFSRLGYPFTAQAVINGKPDFVMPSVDYYRKNPMESIIFTAKRTIRERWRQIVTEGTRGLGFYLATIDPGVSSEQLAEMMSHRIYMVVPHALKMEKYNGRENVISFMEFFRDHLDPRMEVWRRKGVI
ncbi:MAG: type II restriction endonuclease [Cuniculiplasma divulgatum]|jgi:hypothetical protein|nr:MAG: type II restriction endonuclease [Cuniculiplasma divulgatum]